MLLNYSEYPTMSFLQAWKIKSISNFNITLIILYYLCTTWGITVCNCNIQLKSVYEDHPISNKTSSSEENLIHYKTPLSFSNLRAQSLSYLSHFFYINLNL